MFTTYVARRDEHAFHDSKTKLYSCEERRAVGVYCLAREHNTITLKDPILRAKGVSF